MASSRKILVVLSFLFFCSEIFASQNLVLRVPAREEFKDRRNEYPYALLEAALAHAKIKVQLVMVPQSMGQSGLLKMLEGTSKDRLDVTWMVANKPRKKKYLIVNHSIYGPLIGLRIPLVKKENLKVCSEIKKLEDLKKHKIVQVKDWPDFDVLRENKLNVVPAKDYVHAFELITSSRADIFLRGANEVVGEQFANAESLVICPGLVVQYPQEVHFILAPDNKDLHKKLQAALDEYSKTPSYRNLFSTYFRREVDRLQLINRTSIKLKNSNAMGTEADYSPGQEIF